MNFWKIFMLDFEFGDCSNNPEFYLLRGLVEHEHCDLSTATVAPRLFFRPADAPTLRMHHRSLERLLLQLAYGSSVRASYLPIHRVP